VFVVHHLTRTVIKVGTERKTYLSSLEYSLLPSLEYSLLPSLEYSLLPSLEYSLLPSLEYSLLPSGRLGGGSLLLQYRYITLLYGVL
jgi:hypothetical protein